MSTKDKLQRLEKLGVINPDDAETAINRIDERIEQLESEQGEQLQAYKSDIRGFLFA